MATEKELLQKIAENDYELKMARGQVSDLKEKLSDAETILIGLKIKDSRLQESLRVCRATTIRVNEDKSAYEEDIERFRQRLPELLEKLEKGK
jgi:chromosome segregation ATPase